MTTFQAIILGIVQGLTEFLPISSSGHLMLVPWLFGWEEPGLAFDAALHLGSLVAVFLYFWRDFLGMLLALPYALTHPRELLQRDAPVTHDRGDTMSDSLQARPRNADARLALLILLGSIPAGIVGLAMESRIDDLFHGPAHEGRAVALIAVFMIVFGLVLYYIDQHAKLRLRIRDLKVSDAFFIGAAQALALMPGVSRSGITLSAGLLREMKRADAARFSFLLGTPLIAIAGLTSVIDLVQSDLSGSELTAVIAGMTAAAVTGVIAIWGLLRFLQHANLTVFVVYRVLAGSFVLLLLLSNFR